MSSSDKPGAKLTSHTRGLKLTQTNCCLIWTAAAFCCLSTPLHLHPPVQFNLIPGHKRYAELSDYYSPVIARLNDSSLTCTVKTTTYSKGTSSLCLYLTPSPSHTCTACLFQKFKMHFKTLLPYQARLLLSRTETRKDIRYTYNYTPTMQYPIPVKAMNFLSFFFMHTLPLCLSHTLYLPLFLVLNSSPPQRCR